MLSSLNIRLKSSRCICACLMAGRIIDSRQEQSASCCQLITADSFTGLCMNEMHQAHPETITTQCEDKCFVGCVALRDPKSKSLPLGFCCLTAICIAKYMPDATDPTGTFLLLVFISVDSSPSAKKLLCRVLTNDTATQCCAESTSH